MNEVLAQSLQRVPIMVSAILGDAEIPVQQFLALKAGDIVTLSTPTDAEIPLFIEGNPKFLGTPAIHRGSLSLQIKQIVKE
jgi:flagellar motor switch protein FliM